MIFGLRNKSCTGLTLVELHGEPVDLTPGCGDIAIARGSVETMDALFAKLTAWAKEDATIANARSCGNEMAILRTKCNGRELVVTFDLGGSDICADQLYVFAEELGIAELDIKSKAYAYTLDIVEFAA